MGTYLDTGYRDRVIEELYVNEQRIVAPSLGIDAARILAHALRARRLEQIWASVTVGLWAVGAALSGGWLTLSLVPSLMLALASRLSDRDTGASPPSQRVSAFLLRWCGRLLFAGFLVLTLAAALLSTGRTLGQAWGTLCTFALLALCAGFQRGQFSRVLAAELSPLRFPDAHGDPAEQNENFRFQRLKQRIRLEQHSPLVMYHPARPFCGAGAAHGPWALAVELSPIKGMQQRPISNRAILDKIRPFVEGLRQSPESSRYGTRDRLRRLEIDECVFLPAEGLRRRVDASYNVHAFEEHRACAVEEGGEQRRHFLRVRVAGWEEELVVTVFVRIHTQGHMLMLEVAPHTLTPIRKAFKNADRTAHGFRTNNSLGKGAWAVARVPGSAAGSLAVLGTAVVHGWRRNIGGYEHALPDGPALSVRELGSEPAGSLFQQMDVSRYLQAIQHRIVNAVQCALAESGYRTDEFAQQITHISNKAVNVSREVASTSTADDIGDGARERQDTGTLTPTMAPTIGTGGDGASG
ncbi:hypothetical protein IPZ69_16685 [Streptomyces olivochromogenes]|nr:hypothetical protein [Streptomyces olivochromogenes]MCF3131965.1 hypothetical protein [Streptomyces olivochromogenes]